MSNGYTFLPRPEAHSPECWDDLMSPVKRAVRDLLVRIEGAERGIVRGDKVVVANCFLVGGDRGTGKTTVLLSAREAIFHTEKKEETEETEEGYGKAKSSEKRFWKDKIDEQSKTSPQECGNELKDRAKESAKYLKGQNIIWLDPLDLEPVPSTANPLTTLLIRVRGALGTPDREQRRTELTSPFEENADGARQLLSRLINDATLMWEDIHETDTRSRANRQVAAADIYAEFRKRFEQAMEALSKELGQRHGNHDKGCSVVLPIDNIDRSTDHLYNIIKLAQMVARTRLWLVMAGDREDFEPFLERAYWREAIRIGESAVSTGKLTVLGEDETFIMARRQAMAASEKVLPQSHRVKIQRLSPTETLDFSLTNNDDEKIIKLLKKIPIPTTNEERNGKTNSITLLDLFNGKKWGTESDLTQAAKQGLRLSARSVLELWQLLYGMVYDLPTSEFDFRAEKIARTMLQNAIAGSNLGSNHGQLLQENIIRSTGDGGTLLYFGDGKLKGWYITSPDFTLPTKISVDNNSRTKITVNQVKHVALNIEYKEDDPKQKIQLPNLVEAWLSVLYDILMLAETQVGSSVYWKDGRRQPQRPLYTNIVEVFHECTNNEQNSGVTFCISWPVPEWGLLLANEVFRQWWCRFLSSIKVSKLWYQGGKEVQDRLLASVWVTCVLKTFVAFCPLTSESPALSVMEEITSVIEKNDEATDEQNKKVPNPVGDFEKMVMQAVASIYRETQQEPLTLAEPKAFFEQKLRMAVKDWLERQLPLLLCQLYIPMTNDEADKWHKEIKSYLINQDAKDKSHELPTKWIENEKLRFIDLGLDVVDTNTDTQLVKVELKDYFTLTKGYWDEQPDPKNSNS